MKNVIKTIRKSILLVTVFTTMLSNANEISTFDYKADLKATVSLTINNVHKGDQLSIKNYYGTILYKESINISGTYKKGFDLTLLPDGKYFFEIDKKLEIKTVPFTVNLSKVVFEKSKETTLFKPFIRKKDDFLYISQLSTKKEALNIEVYYNSNNEYQLVLSDKIEDVQNIERVFKLHKGDYKLVFRFNDKEITEFISN